MRLETEAGQGVHSGNAYPMKLASQSLPATWSVAKVGLVPAATATDIFTISGSATAIVRIRRLRISAVATGAAIGTGFLIRRSAANTGGTSATPALVSHDQGDAAPSAVVRTYTANPTGLGTAIGTLKELRIFFSVAASGQPERLLFDYFTTLGQKPITLRGAADFLAFNWGGAAIPAGGLFDFDIEATEEAT